MSGRTWGVGVGAALAGLALGVAATIGYGAWSNRASDSDLAPTAVEAGSQIGDAPVSPAASGLDAWLTSENEADRFSGAVLVTRGNEVLLRRAYGLADRGLNVPITPETRFRLASVTKQFTAAAILKLQDDGVLKVTDPVCQWIKPCPDAWAPVTLHHLLTHTAGVHELLRQPNYADRSRREATPRDLTAASAVLPLNFTPGTRFRYSNSGYNLLGDVIERASGKSYGQYLEETFFEPLEMTETGLDDGKTVIPNLAQGYDGPDQLPRWREPSVIFAAGGLVSTLDDMRRWTEGLHAGRVVSAAALNQMLGRDQSGGPYSIRQRRGAALLYGYGLIRAPAGRLVDPGFDVEQAYHTGSWAGFRNIVSHAPSANATVVVLSNRLDQADQVLLVSQKGMAAALGRPTPERLAPRAEGDGVVSGLEQAAGR